MRFHVLTLALLLAIAAPAAAEPPQTRAGALLSLAGSPTELRAGLLAYADSAAAAGDAVGAGEALGYAGYSLQREGRIDSAIVCHRRSLELVPSEEALFALTDQLLLRRRAGDLTEALTRLEAARAAPESGSPTGILGRMAWARFQQGRVDSARALFALVGPRLQSSPEWRYRLGRVALEQKEYRRTADLLLPEAVRTRGMDDDINGMLDRAGNALGMTRQLQQSVRQQVQDRDRPTHEIARELGGRVVTFSASDGFPLGGLLVPAPASTARRRPLLAVVLLAPADSVTVGDSLVTAFRRHGMTTLLLQPRGTGLSVAPYCPSPESWFDREAELQARIARDVGDAVRWARSASPVDTSRYVVAGVGASATMAVEAVTLDRRVRVLLLVSPTPDLVDWGTTRARLARLRLPVFFQIGADDMVASRQLTEALYQAGNCAASRVVEARVPGSGLTQFRADPQLAGRFLGWLDAALAAPGTTRAKHPS